MAQTFGKTRRSLYKLTRKGIYWQAFSPRAGVGLFVSRQDARDWLRCEYRRLNNV